MATVGQRHIDSLNLPSFCFKGYTSDSITVKPV